MGKRQSPRDKRRARDQERSKQQPRRQDEQTDVERVEGRRPERGGKPGGDMDF
ncbi:hypothetical protein [Streptomyces sp. NPDC051214]|uniref:hypothetical protein n=1 Tax=Streptomyces sp. NPDC051214 TaxID=3155282 RepID=UPI0034477533